MVNLLSVESDRSVMRKDESGLAKEQGCKWYGAWVLKNCRASIWPDAGTKATFSVRDRDFGIAGIKRREHLVHLFRFYIFKFRKVKDIITYSASWLILFSSLYKYCCSPPVQL